MCLSQSKCYYVIMLLCYYVIMLFIGHIDHIITDVGIFFGDVGVIFLDELIDGDVNLMTDGGVPNKSRFVVIENNFGKER